MSAGATDHTPHGPAQFLVGLVLNPQDIGYEQAASRRASTGRRRRWYDRPGLILGCFLIGYITVVAYVHTHRGAPEAGKVHASLVARVGGAEVTADGLEKQVNSLSSELNTARNAALPATGALARSLNRDMLSAGQTPVVGPGVSVTLSEPTAASPAPEPGRAGTVPITATRQLSDRDVRSVVNELWAGGAEAISVNGIRLVATTAIRFAGQVILVDFQPITSPYKVSAIGNAGALVTSFASSRVARRYMTRASATGIGFTFSEVAALDLPAAAASTLRYAHPVTAPGGSK